jgi:hypothetical protein
MMRDARNVSTDAIQKMQQSQSNTFSCLPQSFVCHNRTSQRDHHRSQAVDDKTTQHQEKSSVKMQSFITLAANFVLWITTKLFSLQQTSSTPKNWNHDV